jgi:dienelactone hydrolase
LHEPHATLTSIQSFDVMAWVGRHNPAHSLALTQKVITGLKGQGVSLFGATGYCYGARVSIDLALNNTTKAIAISHPSFLQVPEDFEVQHCVFALHVLRLMRPPQKLKAQSNNPILINACEIDQQFPPEKQKITDELLGYGQYTPGYERAYFAGCTHGFAVRGDLVSARRIQCPVTANVGNAEQTRGKGRQGGRVQECCPVPAQTPLNMSVPLLVA